MASIKDNSSWKYGTETIHSRFKKMYVLLSSIWKNLRNRLFVRKLHKRINGNKGADNSSWDIQIGLILRLTIYKWSSSALKLIKGKWWDIMAET